jgi:transcriptional regulator with GAF, ATPase, and Fis domain
MDEEVRFRLLYDLGCAFAARIEIDQLIPLVVNKCREALDAEGASVLLLDDERKELYFPYISEEDPEVAERLARLRFSAELGIAATALKSGKALVVNDAQNDPRLYHGIDKLTGLVTRNVLAAPLSTRQGTIGVVEVVNGRGAEGFTKDDLAFLEAISGSIAIAIENARLYTQVRESEASLQTQVGALRRDLARHDAFTEIVGTGPAMSEVLRLMETAAASSITVLIHGETGTGKELVARGLHRASARSDHPFLALNCAAMPEPLLESELFGHRRGAFTGAIRDNPGLFRAAAGGVVFLDEVADMPLPMQAKLLRVLEEQEVVPLGDSFPRKVDVRVLSATNRNLKAEVAAGRFREDLYYRLAVFPIALPPLRERREDVALLATRFLAIAAEQQRKPIAGFDPAAIELLTKYDWPGNVRELRNEIERAVALAPASASVTPEHLSAALRAQGGIGNGASPNHAAPNRVRQVIAAVAASSAPENEDAKGPLRRARAAFEAEYIAKALDHHHGNVSRAAIALGLSRAALQKKMKDYGLRQ